MSREKAKNSDRTSSISPICHLITHEIPSTLSIAMSYDHGCHGLHRKSYLQIPHAYASPRLETCWTAVNFVNHLESTWPKKRDGKPAKDARTAVSETLTQPGSRGQLSFQLHHLTHPSVLVVAHLFNVQ